jgi:putative transposase
MSAKQRRSLVDCYDELSVTRQCELLGLNRTTLYYRPLPPRAMELLVKQVIDYIYTKWPFLGYRRITNELVNVYGLAVDRNTVLSYMREMGIQAVYPKPGLSKPNMEQWVYPYLLKGVEIKHPNHVWSTDITYIPMRGGFMYLTAVIDWFSRYVLSWVLSESLEIGFVLDVSRAALKQGTPRIMNSDQGSHYTSPKYTELFASAGVAISMDHKGRCFDNIFVERLWRSVKYELIYLNEFSSPRELRAALTNYFKFYNNERFHQSLAYRTPAQVYFDPALNKER